LWGAKLWAEYLTIIATASFIPVEVYEIISRISAPKLVTLVLNIVIVVHLVAQVRRRRHGVGVP
jgi:uncharacterized membrane protein (DUF2068 family)